MTRKALLVVLLALAAAPRAALADAKVEAQTRMEHATELYREGKYSEALNELTIAYTLDPRPDILYAIGQMHVQLGNCPQAILFYERFLSTKPDPVPAAAASEAIETCKHKPEAVEKPPTPTPPVQPPTPEKPVTPPAKEAERPAWYTDKLGAVLLGGGVVLGAAGIVTYTLARSDLDDAERAPDYQTHADLVDSAHGKRTIAAVLGVAGLGLTGAAVTRYLMVRRAGAQSTVGVAPAQGGGLVTWSGQF
jgi:tetratricopeptide (TPR) repeat protein